MAYPNQRKAIARIISDLIRSDNIIEKEELDKFKQVVLCFGIEDKELCDAQDITLSDAMNIVKGLSDLEKDLLRKYLVATANADNACVAREALIMLTLNLILDDKEDKYELLSYDTHGSYTNDKYVIYIEGDEMPIINDEIVSRYDHISNLLKLWKFDFIYIPKVAEKFQTMDSDYLRSIIHYMNPRLSDSKIEAQYHKLIHIDTAAFVRDFLANERRQGKLINTDPSLLINIGTSVVPYCRQNEEGHTYTEFLKIKLDVEEENCVLEEMRRFLSKYQDILTEPEYYRPDRRKDYFKYFGFYKTLFDFLTRIETDGVENDIVINVDRRSIKMQGIDVKLSNTELATYVLILWQTIYSKNEGLLKITRNNKDNFPKKENSEITRLYAHIIKFFRDSPYDNIYENDFDNVKAYVARIRKKIHKQIRDRDIGHYLPLDDNNVYKITINPESVFVEEYGVKKKMSDCDMVQKYLKMK